MAAISDSSALILYARVGRLSLLQQLFTTVFIPPAVYEEVVSSGSGRPGSFEVLDLPWIQQSPLTKTATLPAEAESLGRGELEAIALATDFGGLLPLLLDDRLARRVAQEQGLIVLGSARVPLLAKDRNLIRDVQPVLDELRTAGLYLSSSLYTELLALAGEKPG